LRRKGKQKETLEKERGTLEKRENPGMGVRLRGECEPLWGKGGSYLERRTKKAGKSSSTNIAHNE